LIGAQAAATVSTYALYAAYLALIGALTFGLGAAIAGITSKFSTMNAKIESATDSLRAFGAVGNSIDGMDVGMSTATASTQNGAQQQRGYGSARDVTVVAPDKETGNAIANEITFKDDNPSNTSSTENRDSRYNNE
jgi:hypothetical protein